MKKIVMVLAIVLIVSGAVWAQAPDPFPASLEGAVKTESTEKRYSAGTFSGDVDDYIDPTAFNGEIGTFMFAGGFPGGASSATTALTGFPNTGVTTDDTISLGFAKSLGKANYLALYYGGSFVNASGKSIGKDTDANPKIEHNTTDVDATWRNSLAVLFGIGSMGLTFDLIMDNTEDKTSTIDGKVSSQTIDGAPSIALGWGANFNDKLTPWVKLAFAFPDTTVVTTRKDDVVDKKATYSRDAKFGLDAGAWFSLNDTSSMSAGLLIGALFPDSYAGDKDALSLGFPTANYKDSTEPAAFTEKGAFAIGLYADFTKELTFGENVTVKIKPNLSLGFLTESNDASWYDADAKQPTNDYFQLATGLDIGAQYVYDKIALYTGLGLNIFEWTTAGHSGGGKENKNTQTDWTISGLSWDSERFGSGGSLGFGLTFTPIEGLVFGTGLNVGAIFNPVLMTVNPGSGSGIAAPSWWSASSLSITVSYKFASKAKEE